MSGQQPGVGASHIDTYRDVGAVRVKRALPSAAIDALQAELDTIIDDLRANSVAPRAHDDPVFRDIEFEDHDGYVRLVNAMPRYPSLKAWLDKSDCADIVGRVIGADDLRVWLDATFAKDGDAPETATPWHNDECTFSLQGEHLPSLWIALTDVDETNAPLVTLANSHRDEFRYHSPMSPQDVDPPPGFRPWSELTARVEAPNADIRVWTAKRGDVLIIHPKTIHASRSPCVGLAAMSCGNPRR